MRQMAHRLTSTQERGDLGWWFEGTMTALILLDFVALIAVGGEADAVVTTEQVELLQSVKMLTFIVGMVFTFEMLLGVVALGLWFESPRTYLRSDGANVFDFLIIVTMWLLYVLPDDVSNQTIACD
jgi:hypothetical protein